MDHGCSVSDLLRAMSSKGRRSRNKVSVGEPAEGSPDLIDHCIHARRGYSLFLRSFSATSMVDVSIIPVNQSLADGCLGSCIDEERSNQRYTMIGALS